MQGIAVNHSISPAQVLLRWALQKGYNVIPGTGNPERQKENLAIYSVKLTEEEMTKIDMLRDHPGYMIHDMFTPASWGFPSGKIMWEHMFPRVDRPFPFVLTETKSSESPNSSPHKFAIFLDKELGGGRGSAAL